MKQDLKQLHVLRLAELEGKYIVVRRNLLRFKDLFRLRVSDYYFTEDGFLVIRPRSLDSFIYRSTFLDPHEIKNYEDLRNIVLDYFNYFKPPDCPF